MFKTTLRYKTFCLNCILSELANKFLVIKIFRSQLLGQDILAARTRQLSLPSFLIRGKECFLFSTLYCLNCFTLQANLFTYTTFLYLILFFYLIPHHRNKKPQLQTCTHISNNIHISPLNIHVLSKWPISTSCFMNTSCFIIAY